MRSFFTKSRSGSKLLLAALMTAFAVPASGAGANKAKTEAERLIAEGIRLREARKDADALARFQKADALFHSGRAVAQIALAEQALGRWVEAEAHLLRALEDKSDGWIRAHKAALESGLHQIAQRLGDLEIIANVPGASVKVNGADAGKLPFDRPLRVLAGTSVVEVSAEGHWPLSRSIHVPAGGAARETFTLAENKPAPEVAEKKEPLPDGPVRPAAGELPSVQASPPLTASAEVHEERASLAPWAWVSAGGAAAGVAAGVVGLLVGESEIKQYNSNDCLSVLHTRQENCGSKLSAGNTARSVALGGFVAAAALTITAAVLWVMND